MFLQCISTRLRKIPTRSYPDGVVAGLDARRHVSDGLQPAGALAVHRAEGHGVRYPRPHLRHAARERARARLQDVAHAYLSRERRQVVMRRGEKTARRLEKRLHGGARPASDLGEFVLVVF